MRQKKTSRSTNIPIAFSGRAPGGPARFESARSALPTNPRQGTASYGDVSGSA
jgi:hypothetical protein